MSMTVSRFSSESRKNFCERRPFSVTGVARLAILFPFGERLRMLVVRKRHRRAFELTECRQIVDGYDVGSIGDLFR